MLAQWWKWIYLMDHVRTTACVMIVWPKGLEWVFNCMGNLFSCSGNIHVPGISKFTRTNPIHVKFNGFCNGRIPFCCFKPWASYCGILVVFIKFAEISGQTSFMQRYLLWWSVCSTILGFVSCPWNEINVPIIYYGRGEWYHEKLNGAAGVKHQSFIIHGNMPTQSLSTPAERHICITVWRRVNMK